MKRTILTHLKAWKQSADRKPLLIRGARQVGKSFVVGQLGELFENFVVVNFELEPQYKRCFESLNPKEIINSISLLKNVEIIPGKTLLFLDEIQNCLPALQALRYFKELLPELHVIAAGSLLEFELHRENISMPVGRVECIYMRPCSFEEFMLNSEQHKLWEALENASVKNSLSEAVHHRLLQLFKEYTIVGGMPEAMRSYFETKDLHQLQRIQNSILQTYRDDFGKYANVAHHKYLQTVYDKVPGMLGTQISYQKIDAEFRSRELKNAINLLEHAGVIQKISATAASGLPLSATLQEKKFKLNFLDIGLVQRKTGLTVETLMNEDILNLNAGALAEQAVGQELSAYQDVFSPAELYFWARDKKSSQAEVDYIINIGRNIIPIEVKAGEAGHLKSLQLFLKEYNIPVGIKISSAALSYKPSLLNIPLYMLHQLPKLYTEVTEGNKK